MLSTLLIILAASIIPTIILVVAGLAFIVAGLVSYSTLGRTPETYYSITDKEILLLVASQPDLVISAETLASNSALTKSQAKKRLGILHHYGVLHGMHNWNGLATHMRLKESIKEERLPGLSSDPFLSMEDLMILFRHHNYRLSLQHLCIATNLPINIIVREMNYFKKQKVVDQVTDSYSEDGMTTISSIKYYILKEPYRNDPEAYLLNQKSYDLDLSKIYASFEQKREK